MRLRLLWLAPVAVLLPLALAGCVPVEPDPPIAPPIVESAAPAVRDAMLDAERWTLRIDEPSDGLASCWNEDPSTGEVRHGEHNGGKFVEIVLLPEAVSADATRIARCVSELDAMATLTVYGPQDSALVEHDAD